MKKLTVLAVVTAIIGLTACKTDKPGGPAPEPGINHPDTVWVDYNGSVDLSTLFSVVGTTGTLEYSVYRQPEYAEGSGDYISLSAWELTGTTLNSKPNVRIPDAIAITSARTRAVREGLIHVAVTGSTTIAPITVVAAQKKSSKPALTPNVYLVNNSNYTDGPDGKLLTLYTTSNGMRTFTASSFDVSPIDFDQNNIVVRPKSGSAYILAPGAPLPGGTGTAAATQAGGINAAYGTGDYVIAFYPTDRSTSGIQAAFDAAVAATDADPDSPLGARLYVNVDYVGPDGVVGIVASTWGTSTTAFWRNNANGRQLPNSFVLMKLNSGNTRPYDGTEDGALTIYGGQFNQYLEGRTTEDADHPGWWSHVALKASEDLPPVGTNVTFTVTVKQHHLDPDWTVDVSVNTVAANPG
ncbi:MAG: hypothetical protein LBH06_08730 [Rikenellaceae bacterium]|jgi:hypothetical protein|nr:hypothetical protein [Rikenellaceae bacterium]